METQRKFVYFVKKNCDDGAITIVDIYAPAYEDVEVLIIPQYVNYCGEVLPVVSVELSSDARNEMVNLRRVELPEGLLSIGEKCFESMNVECVNFPSSLKTVCDRAFFGCKCLKEVILPEGLASVGRQAFGGIGGGRCWPRVYVPESAYLDREAFEDARLGRTKVMCSVIGVSAFKGAVFKSLTLSPDLWEIMEEGFEGSNALYLIGSLPDTLHRIDKKAFAIANSSMAKTHSIHLPDSVEVGTEVFKGSGELYRVVTGKSTWRNLMQADSTFCESGIVEVLIPEGVWSLGKSVCEKCKNLKSVNIPSSVRVVEQYAFSKSGLQWLSVPSSVESVGCMAFADMFGCKYIDADPDVWVRLLSELSVVGNGMNHITLPQGLKVMPVRALENCRSLYSVTLPKGITKIDMGAMKGCAMLRRVAVPQGVIDIENEAFMCCHSLQTVALPEGLVNIGDGAFGYCTSLTSIEIPSTVSVMSEDVFNGCYCLKRLILKNKPTDDAYPWDCRSGIVWYVPDEYLEEAKSINSDSLRVILPISELPDFCESTRPHVAPPGTKRVRLRIEPDCYSYANTYAFIAYDVIPEHLPLLSDTEKIAPLMVRYMLGGFGRGRIVPYVLFKNKEVECVALDNQYAEIRDFDINWGHLRRGKAPLVDGAPIIMQSFTMSYTVMCEFFIGADDEFRACDVIFNSYDIGENTAVDLSGIYYRGQWIESRIYFKEMEFDISATTLDDISECFYLRESLVYAISGNGSFRMVSPYTSVLDVSLSKRLLGGIAVSPLVPIAP